ncbi:helix-turn-helix transcriptional regulator [Streptomyces sp. NPDC026672]|uniref:helix-turn-helix domain-containing protein n=1 Tax=unclassified Streptomyces TaxID=2593676 RepID=UPI0033C77C60
MDKCLGDFLRARRARLTPEDVGIAPLGGARRVPGLRREEIARLAGVSVEYYVRLEQGRARNVSDAVLEAVARALRLDVTETRYLFQVARPHRARRDVDPAPHEAPVRPGVQRLLDQLRDVPAIVVDHVLRIRAANVLALALFDLSPRRYDGGRDLARRIFLEEDSRVWLPDWDMHAAAVVAALRLHAGQGRDDREMAALIGELSLKSDPFRRLWADHEVRTPAYGVTRMRHATGGELKVEHETLTLPGDPELTIHTYGPADAETAERLTLLASWMAEPHPDTPNHPLDAEPTAPADGTPSDA